MKMRHKKIKYKYDKKRYILNIIRNAFNEDRKNEDETLKDFYIRTRLKTLITTISKS